MLRYTSCTFSLKIIDFSGDNLIEDNRFFRRQSHNTVCNES